MNRLLAETYAGGIHKRCSWDDRLATQILSGRHGVTMVNRPDLYAQWDERVAAENQLITCHNVEPCEMVELFNKTKDLELVSV